MEKLFVVGAGTMGRGIAQVAASVGSQVYLCDISMDVVKKSLDIIKIGLDKLVQKDKMTKSQANELLERIEPAVSYEKSAGSDFVIEAALEDVAIKQSIFRELDAIVPVHIVLASNTTSCSITEVASATQHPERVVGMHFYNPATLMQLVEIMPGILTTRDTLEKTRDLSIKYGKKPVVLEREGPAGITSRVLAGLLNEAVWVLFEGIADVEGIDKAIVLGCNHKMGPFTLMDMIGLDIHLAKTKMLFDKTGDARYRPCYLLEQMVTAGLLGRKAGRGFYDYSTDPAKVSDFFNR